MVAAAQEMASVRRVIEHLVRTSILLAAVLGTASAHAQQESVAESLFRQARDEMKRGEPRDACPKFDESYRLDPSIGTLLNLGLCEEALGHTATAWTKLRQFLDSAPADDDRIPLARERIAKLEAQLPWVRLVVEPAGESLVVQLDGVELYDASLSEAIPVNPGQHWLRITRPTGETSEARFEIYPAERRNIQLTPPILQIPPHEPKPAATNPRPPAASVEQLSRPAPASATKTTSTPGHGNGERVAAYASAAVGAAGLVTASVFGLMALSDKSVVREHCPNHECQTQTGLDAVQSGARNETIANVAFVIGALGLVTGGVLWWHSGRTTAALSVSSNSASLSFVGVIQ